MTICGILHLAGFVRCGTVDPALLLFAFMAGAAAFFAPCSVALLPAYVGYAVRPSKDGEPPPPRSIGSPRLGNNIAMFGALPLVVGFIPLMLRGIGSVSPLPSELYAIIPSLDQAVFLLIGGTATITAGLLLAGKGPAAWRGVVFGGLTTLGFFITFLAVGLPIAFVARGVAPYLTYLALVMGLVLIAMGILMLFGKSINPRLPTFDADVSSPMGFFKFGLAYGVAGLSCTFPVFLAVIAAGLSSGGFTSAMGTFAAYAVGKAAILVGVTVVTVAGGSGLGPKFKQYAPAIARASAWLIILAGAYMLYYFGRVAFITL